MEKVAETIRFVVPPVVKVVAFAGTREAAFARFSEGIGAWWPLATHSLAGKAEGVSVAFEPVAMGGRLVERSDTGEAHVWGSITAFEAPTLLAFTWHVGRAEDTAQMIEVTFEAVGPERTQVKLVHSGWESLGESAEQTRNDYNEGWVHVLGLFIS